MSPRPRSLGPGSVTRPIILVKYINPRRPSPPEAYPREPRMSKKLSRPSEPAKPRGRWRVVVVASAATAVAGFVTAVALTQSGGPPGPAPEGMVWIPGGKFQMGTDDPAPHFADARPVHEVEVDGFWMDATEVTNAQVAQFVQATGYVTVAEKPPVLETIMANSLPGTPPPPPEALVPGAVVFPPPAEAVPWDSEARWWQWVPGANWRHPEGPGSGIAGR